MFLQVHHLFRDLWGHAARILIHPADGIPPELCDWSDADVLFEPLPPKARNGNVVAECVTLFACVPGPEKDWPRSGTWQTVRLARAVRRGLIYFWPDGSVTCEDYAGRRERKPLPF